MLAQEHILKLMLLTSIAELQSLLVTDLPVDWWPAMRLLIETKFG